MRKIIFVLLLPIFLVFATSTAVYAQYENPLGNKIGKEVVTLEEDEVINRDFFAAGDTVEIFGTVNGDVYVAGGVVTVRGVINGDLLVAGGTLNLAGEVMGDIRAAGGNVTINSIVDGNVTVFGGNVEITDNAIITGSLVGGGGNVYVSGPVGKDITFGAGTLTLSSLVGGDIESGVGELKVTSQANLNGNLYYYSDEEATVSDSATISGVIERNDPAKRLAVEVNENEIKRGAKGFLEGVTTTGKMISFTSLLLIGLLILKLFPNYSMNTVAKLKEKTWKSLGIGTLALFVTPIAAFFAMITIIGFPVGLITLLIYFVYLYMSRIFLMLWAGQFLMDKVSKKKNIYGAFLLGLIAYSVVTLIPVVGGFVKFFTLTFSLGAMVLNCKDTYKKALESKIY